jgi:hypothetical protein
VVGEESELVFAVSIVRLEGVPKKIGSEQEFVEQTN